MTESVVMELEDGVLTATLNEPDSMNTLTPGITKGLEEALVRASDDEDVKCLLLTGTGRAFCAGAAVGNFVANAGNSGAEKKVPRKVTLDSWGSSARTVALFSQCDVPIIAAINGAAVGAGFGLATCCDMRFMAESARLGSVFIKRGLASDYGAAYWLPRIVGAGRATEIMFSGELLDAQTSLNIGLANKVFADDELLAESKAYAKMIANGPPLAYTVLRRMMQRTQDMSVAEFAEYEWVNQKILLSTKDLMEGFSAFLEKREPNFR
ncbi:MAG: enoyl-CoA hydratase/isomerase family protein, partial [Pseudomonadales bacterium]|nr:enoyl-CoA hydratase/isomerase family protein [Pseudomonadales bacterium]